jgi:xanthine dehydrogenase FAD-binding subunit
VGPTVILAEDAGAALVGSRADDVALARLDEAAQAVCRPITDKRGTADFRTKIAGVLARRVAAIAYGRAKEGL